MAIKNLKEKLEKIAIPDSTWLEEAKWRKENREWLQRSALIAVRVLRILRERNMPKAELARLMNVTPQQITKIVKGQENFKLETISNLEKALGVTLMNIPQVEFTSQEVLLTQAPVKKKMETSTEVSISYRWKKSILVSKGIKLAELNDITGQYETKVNKCDYLIAA